MRVTIDRAGRIVVPKPLRQQLGLEPVTVLEIELVDSHLELSTVREKPELTAGPNGPALAPTGTPLTARSVRQALEAARERT